MKCELDYCIYNNNGNCLVTKISINDVGMCDACIIVTLEKDYLQTEKRRQLSELEARWEKSEKIDE